MIYALLVGLDLIDPTCYPQIAVDQLLSIAGSASVVQLSDLLKTYYGAQVTTVPPRSDAVQAAYTAMQGQVRSGDTVVAAYVGHGLFFWTTGSTVGSYANHVVGSLKGNHDWTTAIVLEDRLMLAAEFNQMLAGFNPGITVVNIVDCCVSGVMNVQIKNIPELQKLLHVKVTTESAKTIAGKSDALSKAIYNQNAALYDAILAKGPGTLQIDGLQFGASPADQTIVVGDVITPFSNAITNAVKYNSISSYTDLNKIVTSYAVAKEFSPVMYAFGKGKPTLLAQPLFGSAKRLVAPQKN